MTKIRKISIRCENSFCDGVITHKSQLSNLSPRVQGKCPTCEMKIDVKLQHLNLSNVLRTEIV